MRFVRLALKVVMQNDGDFADIILLYYHVASSLLDSNILFSIFSSIHTVVLEAVVK